VQLSATSHAPEAERQTVVDGAKPSAGHKAPEPVQVSATSHAPALERQTVVDAAKPSAGQLGVPPAQVSAMSQTPALERQTKPDGRNPSAGQLAVPPAQVSATSHAPAAERHTVPDGANESGGQAVLTPLQVSAMSHAPAAERHTVPDGWTPPTHVELVPLHVPDAAHAPSGVQTVPFGLKWQLASQQDCAVPFSAPSSQSSPWLGWTLPLPQGPAAAADEAKSSSARAIVRNERMRAGRTSSVVCMGALARRVPRSRSRTSAR
jgi:hypothetical protein